MTTTNESDSESSDPKAWDKSFVVSKTDAAKRMFDTSVDMFFGQGDDVSVYLLAASASQILEDLLASRGSGGLIRNKHVIKEGKRKEYFDAIKKCENFFKHADRDPEVVLDFSTATTPLMLIAVCDLLPRFMGGFHIHTIVYRLWFMAAYPEGVKDSGREFSALLGSVVPPEDFKTYRLMLKEPIASQLVAQTNWVVPDVPEGPYAIFLGA